MIKINDKKNCSGCAACYNICPINAINMEEDNEGFLYPKVNEQKCIHCKKCIQVCPYLKQKKSKINKDKDCYAAYSNNSNDRSISSSGGIFITLARTILNDGGIVYGAAFDDSFMVYHKGVERELDIWELVGSKYLQSRIGDIYTKVKENLQKDRKVLFAGTTCQVAGLKSFLGKDYKNLLCVDFICLGIPSPKIWKDYLNTYFDGENIKAINFKDKVKGWHSFSLRISFNNGNFVKRGSETKFFAGYFNGLFSRPSCSKCIFKTSERPSDITLADCWGCEKMVPELDDNKGLSSVILHSEKGKEYFNQIKKNLFFKEISLTDIMKYNENYFLPKPMGKKREEFWNDYNKIEKKELFEKYCINNSSKNVFTSIKNKVRKMFQRYIWRL